MDMDEDEELDDELLFEEIRRCPEKYFTQYLYGTDTVSIVGLLNRLIQNKNGFEVAIECLSCWQDIIGANYCLEPILNELQQAENAKVICLCLKLLNQLLKYSPSAVTRIRIDHELKELNVSERVNQIRALLNSGTFGEFDHEISEQIGQWHSEHLQDGVTCSRGRSSSFTELEDSNSFTEESEDEEEAEDDNDNGGGYRMASVETVQSSQAWNNNGNVSLNSVVNAQILDAKNLDDSCYKDNTLVQLVNLLINKTDSVNLNNLKQMIETLLLKCNSNDTEMVVGMAMGLGKQKIRGEAVEENELIKASSVRSMLPTVVRSPTPTPPPPPPPPPLPPSSETSGPPPAPPLQLNPKEFKESVKKKVDIPIPKALKPKAMPKAGSQMKQIQWTKIPVEKVIGDGMQKIRNVWMSSARLSENELHLNFDELESMFSCASARTCTDASGTERRTTRKNAVIALLSHKRSFNVSIFLKQFKEGTSQIIENVRNGQGEFFGLERLNNLRAILPDSEEIEILRGFSGDQTQLGIAEQFFLSLLTVSDYKLILDCMILKEELGIAFETLLPHIDTIINSCIEIKESKALPKIFCMLVQIGNFLNANATFGNAAGFKLNSLWRILDVKATQKSITLLHFIAMQDQECTEKLLDELLTVPVAARLSLESIRNDVRTISDKLINVSNEVRKRTDVRFFEDTNQHFTNSRQHMANMQEQLEQMDQLISYLAAYFCEDEKHFKIEECFKILSTFICRLRDALSDNEKRTRRMKRLEERTNVENIVSDNSSKLNLSKKIKNNNKTLEELLESDSHSDIRHCRPRSNTSQSNIVVKLSDEERKDLKIVHRTVRKLRDEVFDGADDMSPIMKLRKQSRNKSDAYLIRHSQNLDEFLEAAERVEKEAVKQHVESIPPCYSNSEETPQELTEIAPASLISSEDTPSRIGASTLTELEQVPLSSALEEVTSGACSVVARVQDAALIAGETVLYSMDKMKQRIAVERAAEIPLPKTIRGVRTKKSVEKRTTENSRTSPYRITAPKQQPFTVTTAQLSATAVAATRKAAVIEQSSGSKSKSPLQSRKSITTPTSQEILTKRCSGIALKNKLEVNSSKTTKTTFPRKPRPDMTGTSSSSARSMASIRTPKKPPELCTEDTEIPCTSNSSVENSPQRPRGANRHFDLASHDSVDSQPLCGATYRSVNLKSSLPLAKGVPHLRDNSSRSTMSNQDRPATVLNHDASSKSLAVSHPTAVPNQDRLPTISSHDSSKSLAASRPKSAPNRTITGITPAARIISSRTSPFPPRRPVRGTARPGTQILTSEATSSPQNKTMKRTDSCSTASRPLLIKTGTVSRPRWK